MTYVPLKDRVEAMADDHTPAQIGEKIGISERAVRVHLAKAAGKLTAPQLAAMTGATYRQINHWTVKGYLSHIYLGEVKGVGTQRKGSGSEIMFETDAVQLVTTVLELIDIGFEVDCAFGVVATMKTLGLTPVLGVRLEHGWTLIKRADR